MSLFISTPCYGSQVTEPYFSSCMKLQQAFLHPEVNFPHRFHTLSNDSLITRARNICTADFLGSDFERMIFIDADIEFTVDDVGKLWAMDMPVAVGVYRMKKPGSRYAAWREGALIDDLDQFSRPITVDYAGTGFMMIKREVFTEIADSFPEYAYEEGSGPCFGYFQDPIMEGFHMSEDYFFCHTWRELGHEVWMDPSVRLTHHGLFAYGNDDAIVGSPDPEPECGEVQRPTADSGNGTLRLGGHEGPA